MAQGRSTNIISRIKRIRTSRLSMKNSLSDLLLLGAVGCGEGRCAAARVVCEHACREYQRWCQGGVNIPHKPSRAKAKPRHPEAVSTSRKSQEQQAGDRRESETVALSHTQPDAASERMPPDKVGRPKSWALSREAGQRSEFRRDV